MRVTLACMALARCEGRCEHQTTCQAPAGREGEGDEQALHEGMLKGQSKAWTSLGAGSRTPVNRSNEFSEQKCGAPGFCARLWRENCDDSAPD